MKKDNLVKLLLFVMYLFTGTLFYHIGDFVKGLSMEQLKVASIIAVFCLMLVIWCIAVGFLYNYYKAKYGELTIEKLFEWINKREYTAERKSL